MGGFVGADIRCDHSVEIADHRAGLAVVTKPLADDLANDGKEDAHG